MTNGTAKIPSNGRAVRLASNHPQIPVLTAIIAAAAMQTKKMPPAIAPSASPPPWPVIVRGNRNARPTNIEVPIEAIRPTLRVGFIAGHCLMPGPA